MITLFATKEEYFQFKKNHQYIINNTVNDLKTFDNAYSEAEASYPFIYEAYVYEDKSFIYRANSPIGRILFLISKLFPPNYPSIMPKDIQIIYSIIDNILAVNLCIYTICTLEYLNCENTYVPFLQEYKKRYAKSTYEEEKLDIIRFFKSQESSAKTDYTYQFINIRKEEVLKIHKFNLCMGFTLLLNRKWNSPYITPISFDTSLKQLNNRIADQAKHRLKSRNAIKAVLNNSIMIEKEWTYDVEISNGNRNDSTYQRADKIIFDHTKEIYFHGHSVISSIKNMSESTTFDLSIWLDKLRIFSSFAFTYRAEDLFKYYQRIFTNYSDNDILDTINLDLLFKMRLFFSILYSYHGNDAACLQDVTDFHNDISGFYELHNNNLSDDEVDSFYNNISTLWDDEIEEVTKCFLQDIYTNPKIVIPQ